MAKRKRKTKSQREKISQELISRLISVDEINRKYSELCNRIQEAGFEIIDTKKSESLYRLSKQDPKYSYVAPWYKRKEHISSSLLENMDASIEVYSGNYRTTIVVPPRNGEKICCAGQMTLENAVNYMEALVAFSRLVGTGGHFPSDLLLDDCRLRRLAEHYGIDLTNADFNSEEGASRYMEQPAEVDGIKLCLDIQRHWPNQNFKWVDFSRKEDYLIGIEEVGGISRKVIDATGKKTYEGESLDPGLLYASYYLENFVVAFSEESYDEHNNEYVLKDFIPDSEMPWKRSEMSREKFVEGVKRYNGPSPTLGRYPPRGFTPNVGTPARDDDGHSTKIWE